MILRRARPEDRDWFCGMAASKTLPPHPHTGISGAQRCQQLVDRYAQGWETMLAHPQLLVLVSQEPDDYVILLRGESETVTGERQSRIWDWGCDPRHFLPTLLRQAAQFGDRYLVVRALPGEEESFRSLGFMPELRRLLAPMSGKANTSQFGIRPATAMDAFFIANLHSQSGPFYVPANRQVDLNEISLSSGAHYLSMNFGPDCPVWGRILTWEGKPAGYILYKLGLQIEESGSSAAYLYDISLLPEARGRMGAQILVRHTMAELAEKGVEYIVADVSVDNEQAFGIGTRSLQFEVEWTRLGMKTPPAKEPSKSEKAPTRR